MGIGNRRNVTKSVDFGELGEKEVDFEVIYYPSEPDKGMFGPFENASQGHGSELDIVTTKIGERDVIWLFDTEALRLIADEICSELDGEACEFDVPDFDERWAA